MLTLQPSGQRVRASKGDSFLAVIRDAGSYIPTDCGGKGTCGKCVVSLHPAPNPTATDSKHLTQEQIDNGIRLACQHEVQQDTRVTLMTSQGQLKILHDARASESEYQLDGEPGYGVAIDIGTTTVVCYFVDLLSGTQIGVSSFLNPQVSHGEDIISRITHALRESSGMRDLRISLWDTIADNVADWCVSRGILTEEVVRISVVGNTVMHHIALGLDVEPLALAPYQPSMTRSHKMSAGSLGLDSLSEASVYFAPNVAGYVGGDTLGFILSQGLHRKDGVSFGIDVGTNGEIIASSGTCLLCCSTAAGPAFEGARIAQGMRAQDGAIEYVNIENPDEAPEISVIGDHEPIGLCGSGILDAVAELRRVGLIDASGKLLSGKRTCELESLGNAFVLRYPSESTTERHIVITQRDIRQVQLAKAAIRTGIEVLMSRLGVGADSIDSFYLAGAFGNYLRPESALRIGLLPPIMRDRIAPVGNAAGEGAKLILVSRAAREEIERIGEIVEYIELARVPNFDDIFVRAMHLTPKIPQHLPSD